MPTDRLESLRKPEIVPRSPQFDVDDRTNFYWHGGDAAKTAIFDAFSIFLPSGERFFIRSVRYFESRVDDPLLKREVNAFLAQEAIHSREHRIYNAGLEKLGHDVERLEAPVTAALNWVERRTSRVACLAVTCAIEHFT